MALDIVCKRDRDPVIEEQRKTIAKQAQEIEGLKRGEGLVRPVLLAAFNFPENSASCIATETTQAYVKRLWSENNIEPSRQNNSYLDELACIRQSARLKHKRCSS